MSPSYILPWYCSFAPTMTSLSTQISRPNCQSRSPFDNYYDFLAGYQRSYTTAVILRTNRKIMLAMIQPCLWTIKTFNHFTTSDTYDIRSICIQTTFLSFINYILQWDMCIFMCTCENNTWGVFGGQWKMMSDTLFFGCCEVGFHGSSMFWRRQFDETVWRLAAQCRSCILEQSVVLLWCKCLNEKTSNRSSLNTEYSFGYGLGHEVLIIIIKNLLQPLD